MLAWEKHIWCLQGWQCNSIGRHSSQISEILIHGYAQLNRRIKIVDRKLLVRQWGYIRIVSQWWIFGTLWGTSRVGRAPHFSDIFYPLFNPSQMPRHLISDYLAKRQPGERAWNNKRGKKTLLNLTPCTIYNSIRTIIKI